MNFNKVEEEIAKERRGMIVRYGLLEALMKDIEHSHENLLLDLHSSLRKSEADLFNRLASLEKTITDRLENLEEGIANIKEASEESIMEVLSRIEALEANRNPGSCCGNQTVIQEKAETVQSSLDELPTEHQLSIQVVAPGSQQKEIPDLSVSSKSGDGLPGSSEKTTKTSGSQNEQVSGQFEIEEKKSGRRPGANTMLPYELKAVKEDFFKRTFEKYGLVCPGAPEFPSSIKGLPGYIYLKDGGHIWDNAYVFWVDLVEWAKLNIDSEKLKNTEVKFPKKHTSLNFSSVQSISTGAI